MPLQYTEWGRVHREGFEYPTRLMTALSRVTAEDDWDIKIVDGSFHVGRYDLVDVYIMGYDWSPDSQKYLESLECKLHALDVEEAESKRLRELAKSAMAKLSKEERDALGLMDNR